MKTVTKLILLLSCYTINAQSLVINSPKNNSRVKSGDFISVDWKWKNRNIQGKVRVQFSQDKKYWEEIDEVNVSEGNVFWEVPRVFDSDGIVYLRISSSNRKQLTKTISLRYSNNTPNNPVVKKTNKKRNYNTRYTGKFVKIEVKKDNIRSSPSAERGNIIGQCKEGQYYELLGREGRWYIIKYDNQRGYAFTHQTNGSLVTKAEMQKNLDEGGFIAAACSLAFELLLVYGLLALF